MRVDGINPGYPLGKQELKSKLSNVEQAPSFKDTLTTFLNDVNVSQKESGAAQLKLISGEITDVHQVMSKSEEAKVAFNMLMELRNKAMDGYQEIMRIKL